MSYSIDRAAVIGAGVMGANLAAHLANAGIPTLLLDIVPPDSASIDGDPESRAYRDAFARGGLKKALKASPAAFYVKESAALVETGNVEDDLEKLRNVDWVLEAVTEKLDIKESLFERIVGYLKPTAILTSNTSGLSVESMAAILPDELKKRFLVTHFFNPPRYMRLLEIVPNSVTDRAVTEFMADFGEDVLGKGIVYAKDTPNFIANRIGVFSIISVYRIMIENGYTVEEVDLLTGPLIGRPKSASLRTTDLVGLDTLAHTCETVYDRSPDDEQREFFKLPDFIKRMVKENRIGEKAGQGFYKKTKKDGKTEILSLDLATFDYRPKKRPSFPSVDLAQNMEDASERIVALMAAKDRAGEFLWQTVSEALVYSANRLGEIADDIVQIDNAMKWGFNWEMGPFELWDAMGVERVAERLGKEGREIPKVVEAVLKTKSKSFYEKDEKSQRFFVGEGKHESLGEPAKTISLARLKKQNKVVKKNAGASLIDMGDGILCLEFHSKMNAIGADIMQMVTAAVNETEANYEGLVVGNEGTNFSVGANLMLLLFEAQEENWEDIDMIIRSFQRMTMSLKYCKRPVVAAPFGMALGGGCEVVLGAGHACASAETYLGLVEMGVGLVPAGGGCKELLIRNLEGVPRVEGVDLFPFVRATFETIGFARVAMSAEEAKQLRLLRADDGVSMNPARVLHYAKAKAKGLAAQGYRPPSRAVQIPVVGESGIASIKAHLYMLREGNFISEYDAYLGEQLATILCGGRVRTGAMVSEQYLLDLEREVFLRLCGQRKSLERIQHMLKKGKPLRN